MGMNRSRLVLNDLKEVLARLDVCHDQRSWRILWTAAVTLARAVGDVLDKVDGEHNDILRRASNEAYIHWKETPIFRDFIKKERDQLVHRYDSDVSESEHEYLLVSTGNTSEFFDLDDCLFKPLQDGPFAGEDARDVLKDAIEWLAHLIHGRSPDHAKPL